MSKIKVLAIPSDQYGVGKYRILDPFKYIGENYSDEIHVDISLNVNNDDSIFLNYDVVVFHSFIHQLPHEVNVERVKWLKEKGIKVIMDIDDYWSVDQRHPMYKIITSRKIPQNKIELLKLADYVTTTTPIFADTIRKKLNVKNVLVFPNAVNAEEIQFQPNPTPSDKIRFGWLGGSSHLPDIELLTTGISSIQHSYKDKSQFVLCGFDLRGEVSVYDKDGKETRRQVLPHETTWFQYEKIFTNNYNSVDEDYRQYLLKFVDLPYGDIEKQYVRKWTQNISKYAFNYNYFDVSLAPLVDSEFNNNKSQLKIIESGFHKKAIIASEVSPYTLDIVSGVNGLLVPPRRNHKDWFKNMKKLIENPNMIEDLGNKLYETVKDKYSLKNVSESRVQFLKTIINN
jgi:glycosyltransferase involved in cell wall biosynthesis